MDKVTAVRKRLNREQWKSLISECRSSGMTVSRWCNTVHCGGSAVSTEIHMLGDITVAQNIYIACGYTDMRKSIDGLVALVKEQFRWLLEGLKAEQKSTINPANPGDFC